MSTSKILTTEEICKSIFESGFSISEERKQPIKDFVTTTVNGDTVKDYLTITATISKDRDGVLVYVLTNSRLIKIDIDSKTIESTSSFLNEIVGVERKLLEGNTAQVAVNIPNNSFGLRYPSNNETIMSFFQKVEQSRNLGKASGQ